MVGYDVVGDVHGHASKLEQLLLQMGYRSLGGTYQHPTRKAVFVGDFIDAGPEQARVLGIVRPMVDGGHAYAVLGNHEFNAICYHTRHPATGEPLRPHSDKNKSQHEAFLREFPYEAVATCEAVAWFKSLSLFLELDGCRIVHACWDGAALDRLRPQLAPGDRLTDELIVEAATEGTQVFADVETLLKGPEIKLPGGATFRDKYDHVRDSVRVRWWGARPADVGSAAFNPSHVPEPVRELPLDGIGVEPYPVPEPPEHAIPVFFGHYWCRGEPQPLARNVACVDYSAGGGGPLVAYRWDGAEYLAAEHFATSDA